jgi:hypothetical protein
MDFSVPGVGVFVATLVGFVASYLWFGPKTFYPVWWKALGKGAEMPNGGQNMGSLFGTALLATLAQAIVVAVLLGAIADGDASPALGATVGLVVGVAAAMASLGHRLFANQGFLVWILEVGSDVLNLVLMGLVLSYWT